MNRFNPGRSWFIGAVAVLWVIGIIAIFAYAMNRETVVVTHWANGHMTSPTLLPSFAHEFNAAGHTTSSGKRIEVRTVEVNSGAITCQLIRRINPTTACPENEGTGGREAHKQPAPTIVSPAADHWLGEVNYAVGRDVIDLPNTRSLARTWIGIATLREMAQWLGWPDRDSGFGAIKQPRAAPRGGARCPTARA